MEGAAYELCQQVLHKDSPPARARFGYSDDDAFAVGLTCGGEIDVLVQRIDPAANLHLAAALADVVDGRPTAVAQVVAGPSDLIGSTLSVLADGSVIYSSLDGGPTDKLVAEEARALLRAGRTSRVTVGGNGDGCLEPLTLLVHVHASRPRTLIFGAVDFAAALSQASHFLGYRVTVCDARPVFATPARFPYADQVVVDWPHRYLSQTAVDSRTAVCVLTHDAKFDIPLLQLALDLPVGHVGAMGSRRTRDERLRLLSEADVSEDRLARLHSPIGLDLGARTPQETAVSITAGIIAHTNQGTGLPLPQATGPIHRPPPQRSPTTAGRGKKRRIPADGRQGATGTHDPWRRRFHRRSGRARPRTQAVPLVSDPSNTWGDRRTARLRRSRMASDLWLSEVDFGKIENLRIAPCRGRGRRHPAMVRNRRPPSDSALASPIEIR